MKEVDVKNHTNKLMQYISNNANKFKQYFVLNFKFIKGICGNIWLPAIVYSNILFIAMPLSIYFASMFWGSNSVHFRYIVYFILILCLSIYFNFIYRLSNIGSYVKNTNQLILILIESIIMFASAYLWLMILFGDNGFSGIHDINYLWSVTKNQYTAKLYAIAIIKAVIYSFHFSLSTASTVGYGDISPLNPITRIVADFQIIYTFIVVVIGLSKSSN